MAAETLRTSRLLAIALVVGTAFVAQEVFADLLAGKSVDALQLGPRAVVIVGFWLAWVILTPVVRIAIKPRPFAVHAAIGLVLALVQTGIAIKLQFVVRAIADRTSLWTALSSRVPAFPFAWGAFTSVVFYSVLVMVYTAMRFRTMYVAEQLSAAELEAELTQSKLDTLRSQLRPHFLFNTLNAISVFVMEDANKAQQMLLRLSTLLRRSLDEEAHEVPLDVELGFVNDYIEIQRGRFGDQLVVDVAVDPAVLSARVPVFLLQPLLENAIEHGKSEYQATTIALRAARDNDVLRITVTDNGPGVGTGAPVREGIGLTNTRARLHHLYGPRATIDLGAAGPGARIEIRIPFQ
jgi:signal transduction histidine kinase